MQKWHTQKAFSMVELVFVLVILGILAAIAIPRFSLSRIDAQIVAIENDINNAFSTITLEVFSRNLDPKSLDINQIFTLANLSTTRWIVQNNNTLTLAKNFAVDSANSCVSVSYDSAQSTLKFVVTQNTDSTLCTKLLSRHPNGKQMQLNVSNSLF